ncbi:methyltransferase domain-containing protein [Candidatus Nomurabacteria bacterium]|nr:MAG: methyltransferase domain-containing protein [Candidatus Nomurabacteria bacterium]
MESNSLQKIYSEHNINRRGKYFITMEQERGPFLRDVIEKGKDVLDIGCRDGALTKYFFEGNNVLGLDIDQEALDRAQALIPIKVRQVDLNGDWGLQAKTFDVVVAAEVLEHLYYPENITQKASFVLKDNGLFVGSVPFAYSFQSKIRFIFNIKKHTPLQDPTHINHFTYKEFRSILEKHFSDVEIIPIVSKKFWLLSWLFKYSFAHMFLFVARNPIRK